MMLLILLLIAVATIASAPSTDRPRPHPGPSWFDLLPYMTESKSRRGRTQQTHRHGKRRYGT